MSLEISQETIAEVYGSLHDERIDDWVVVVSATEEARRGNHPIDDTFVRAMAEERRVKAEGYEYPVDGTLATLQSSLRIVRDIMTIRELEATREERLKGVDLRGAGDIVLAGAIGKERMDRLHEKGILRVLDPHTSRTMWSVEHDNPVAQRKAELISPAPFK